MRIDSSDEKVPRIFGFRRREAWAPYLAPRTPVTMVIVARFVWGASTDDQSARQRDDERTTEREAAVRTD